MAKLVWDGVAQRFYEDGVDRGVLYKMSTPGVYDEGVAWNGLTAVNESNEGGDLSDIWADNIKYLSLRSQERFSGTIEAFTYPKEFGECDGTAEVVPGVYVGQQPRKRFGFSYRSMIGNDAGQEYYKVHIVWNAQASPSGKDHATRNDSPDPGTFSWDFTTDPVAINDQVKPSAHMVIDSRYVTAEKLALVENKLYGTDGNGAGTAPELPSPAEIIALVGPAAG